MSQYILMIFLCTHQIRRLIKLIYLKFSTAGVTLRGKKCRIGMSSITYLGHVFSAQGMAPDPNKLQAVQEWPAPRNVTDVR